VTRAEWRGSAAAFRLLDTNHDSVLSGAEVWDERDGARSRSGDEWGGQDNGNGSFVTVAQRFRDLDRNHDGVITRQEWNGTVQSYRALDRNRDSRITRDEFRGRTVADDALDQNENRQSPAGSSRAGTSGNQTANRTNAYQAGYQRGQTEGRSAGREDRVRNQGFDLEGQRELETADAGYEPRVGLKADYQAGYRDGFRVAYPDGWNHPQ
jgi:Ca2+-binding EF-hand superfamily protein